MQIHGADPVVVGCVSAGLAAEDVILLVAVSSGDVSALGTCLRGICRIDSDNGLTVLQSLVKQLPLKIIVGPGDRNVPVSEPNTFGGRADAGQIFQDEERALRMVMDECLTDAVIHIMHPTVFSLTDGLESSSGGGGLHPLQLTAQVLVVSTFLLDNGTGEKAAFPFAVVGCCQETDPAVDADDVRDIRGGDLIDLFCHRDMEKELAVLTDQLRRAEVTARIDTLCKEGDFDPSLQGVDGEQGLITDQRVISVPYEIKLCSFELRPDPLVLVRLDGLIPGHDRAQDRLGHLGAQAESLADGVIEFTLQRSDAQIVEQEDIARDEIAGSGVGMHGIDQKLCIRWIWKDLQFCSKCLFHSKIISRKQAKRNMRSYLNTKNNSKERRDADPSGTLIPPP